MSTSRKIDRICISVLAATLVITILFMNGKSLGLESAARVLGYEKRLFDTSTVHRVDIVMDDWDSFIETCENEEYAACTVVIDGEKYKNIGIRAKGNTSLSNVRQMGSQRYSFKLEFDQYESGKSYYGLDKLCLNNLIQDNTMMKDYLVYTMMADFGADTPLCSFVYITVNGEDWGLYLAVEGLEDSFLERSYGSNAGELYKPDSMSFGGGRGNGKDFNMEEFRKSNEESEDGEETAEGEENAEGKESGTAENGGFQGGDFPGGFPGGDSSGNFPGGDFSGGFPGGDSSGNFPGGDLPDGFPGGGASGGFPGGDFSGGTGSMPQDGGFEAGSMPQDGAAVTGETPAGSGAAEEGNAAFGSTAQESASADGSSTQDKSGRSGGFGGGFGGMFGSDDVKLKYVDDDPDSYSNIFDNAKTDVSKADQKRLISALKNLSEYTDLEDTLDMDEVLRYFVVHNFVCNGDSYTGSMIHNYYLHEQDGKLGMIPWDYNLAFGTFQSGDAEGSVNESIDEPVSRGDVDDRPMVGWIFSDEKYTEEYHALFAEFLDRWFSDGQLASLIEQTAEMIRPYVEKDPTKFCTTEEFESGVSAISEFVTLRAEAVSRQLQGDDTAVETGDLDLSDMGTMSMGGGGKGGFGQGMPGGFDIASMITATDRDGNTVTLKELVGDGAEIASVGLADGTTVDLAGGDFRSLRKTDFSTAVSVTDKDGNVTDLTEYTLSVNMPDRGSRGESFQGGFNGNSVPAEVSGDGSTAGAAAAAPAAAPEDTASGDAADEAPADAANDPSSGNAPAGAPENASGDAADSTSGGAPGGMPSGTEAGMPSGQTDGRPSGMPGGTSSEMSGGMPSGMSGGTPSETSGGKPSEMTEGKSSDRPSGMPSGMPPGMPGQPGDSGKTTWILVGASALVLAAGLVIAIKKEGKGI